MENQYTINQINALIKSRDNLMEILDDGANQIDEAREQGKDVQFMEDIWNKMLNDYGKICDQIRDLHNQAA